MTNRELISRIRLEIKRMISAHKTKNGFPKGSFCAVRIEAYNEVLGLLDTLEEPVEKTCKTCGFYENNCPFIRGKFMPYPSIVCKDFTFSVIKKQGEDSWIWATTPPEKPGKYKVQLRYDTYSAIWNGVKWIDDASGFPIMGVFKWKPIKEEER